MNKSPFFWFIQSKSQKKKRKREGSCFSPFWEQRGASAMKLERIYQAAKKISSLVEEKNYSFSIQSGLECVCMFVSWRGDLLRSRTARVFFSKFIDRCIYRPCQQQNLLALSLSLFVFFFFRANTAKSGAAAAVASRRPLLLPLSFFLLAGL